MKRTLRIATLAFLASFVLSGTASADVNPTASCEGFGSLVAQVGERDDAARQIIALAQQEFGIPSGEIHRFFATQPAGSFEACFGFPAPTQ